ncbi:MAG TPA: DNA-3-methyladenine glycosylase 2 family protein [Sphingomonadales bacterium]|nr:DNA-3-methyladenine glycosylase 2 family protein [Sphingomonadales bacterium]
MSFKLSTRHLRRALDEVARRDADVKRGLRLVGYPKERRSGGPSFEHLLRIIVGQQISTQAAASVYAKLAAALGRVEPRRFLALSDAQLRAQGLSRQKIAYGRILSEAVASRRLVPERLAELPDEEVVAAITALKGFGRWSAEMFLLFSLGRPDVWPSTDLGIQGGLKKLKKLRTRPSPARAEKIAWPWRPYRGAMAVFVWHYYSNAP